MNIIIEPHPDDALLGCFSLLNLGMIDKIITVTDGEASPLNIEKDKHYKGLRKSEAFECANYFDVSWTSLGLPDGKLIYHMDKLKLGLRSVICANDTIFIPNIQEKHLDHKVVGIVGISLCIKNTIMYSVLKDVYPPNMHVFTYLEERRELVKKLFPSQWKDLTSGHFNLNSGEYFQKSTWVEMK